MKDTKHAKGTDRNQKTDKTVANKRETKDKLCMHNTTLKTKARVTRQIQKTRASPNAPKVKQQNQASCAWDKLYVVFLCGKIYM